MLVEGGHRGVVVVGLHRRDLTGGRRARVGGAGPGVLDDEAGHGEARPGRRAADVGHRVLGAAERSSVGVEVAGRRLHRGAQVVGHRRSRAHLGAERRAGQTAPVGLGVVAGRHECVGPRLDRGREAATQPRRGGLDGGGRSLDLGVEAHRGTFR